MRKYEMTRVLYDDRDVRQLAAITDSIAKNFGCKWFMYFEWDDNEDTNLLRKYKEHRTNDEELPTLDFILSELGYPTPYDSDDWTENALSWFMTDNKLNDWLPMVTVYFYI